MSVQCRICESGEYDNLKSLKDHLKTEHGLDRVDIIEYGFEHRRDITFLLHGNEEKEKIIVKFEFKDSFPLLILVISLSLALTNPIIRENDILRVGWAIIHAIICVGYIGVLFILKAISGLEGKL